MMVRFQWRHNNPLVRRPTATWEVAEIKKTNEGGLAIFIHETATKDKQILAADPVSYCSKISRQWFVFDKLGIKKKLVRRPRATGFAIQ